MKTVIARQIVLEAIKRRIVTPNELQRLKNAFAEKTAGQVLPNFYLIEAYRQLLAAGKINQNAAFFKLIRKRAVRTASGVAVITVLTKNYPCPGKCVYCPDEAKMPKSYLSNEPAVMRAILNQFHPFKQVRSRLLSLQISGHDISKIELIVIGGTWSALPKNYQTWFIKELYRALDIPLPLMNHYFQANILGKTGDQPLLIGQRFSTGIPGITRKKDLVSGQINCSPAYRGKKLAELQQINEQAPQRCVGLTLETRPDTLDQREIVRYRRYGCTRVEIGVQHLDNQVLRIIKRGHTVRATITATKLLKDAGFKVCYHLMPNLPGSSWNKDLEMFKDLFSKPDFQPDLIKIYPCVVTPYSKLVEWYQEKKYRPYGSKKLLQLLIALKKMVPPYTRILRIIRDIPGESIVAGSKVTNLRQQVQQAMCEEKSRCRCIRCREIGVRQFNPEAARLIRRNYPASDGQEIFLAYEDCEQDKLLALLRLRIPSPYFTQEKHFIPVLNDCALIREVHTYGVKVPIGDKSGHEAQHQGYGKKLLATAEKIASQEYGLPKIAVIAGVGTRAYYRKFGYRLSGGYMIKKLAVGKSGKGRS